MSSWDAGRSGLTDGARDAERLARLWSLDPHVVFLNHGSFGACPTGVLETQQALRERMERQPVQMLGRDLTQLIPVAREELARFVGADPTGLVFVQNATAGVNTVLRSVAPTLSPGDELLVTDQAYGACRNALDFVAAQRGASVVVAEVPFPFADPDANAQDVSKAIVTTVLGAVSERTRLALLDHVASPTGMIFPVAELTAALQARGVQVLIDGAHAPGMVALELSALGADYYVGNCHKWLCAPKTCGFISVAPAHRTQLRPLVISHGASAPPERRLLEEFDWVGTGDPTPMLCVPEAIHVLSALLPGGWDAIRARNHALALEARSLLCSALGIAAPCPPELIGSMAAVPLPPAGGNPFTLHRILLEEHHIEVQIYPRPAPHPRLLRVSAQLYNRREHYKQLADVLPEALAAERQQNA